MLNVVATEAHGRWSYHVERDSRAHQEQERTWLAYQEPEWLAERHGVGPEAHDTASKMAVALAALARAATGRPSARSG